MNLQPKAFHRRADAEESKAPSGNGSDNRAIPLTVEGMHNHVYFYADVDSDRCLAMMRELRSIDDQLRTERVSRNLPSDFPAVPIWLHVHSYGGDLFAALAVIEQMPHITSPIYSIVEGACCSAASFISMACAKRFIMPSSFMLIHQFSQIVWGTHEEFKDDMVLQYKLIDRIVRFYSSRSKLDAETIRERLKHNYWMDADQALADGFVDEIMG